MQTMDLASKGQSSTPPRGKRGSPLDRSRIARRWAGQTSRGGRRATPDLNNRHGRAQTRWTQHAAPLEQRAIRAAGGFFSPLNTLAMALSVLGLFRTGLPNFSPIRHRNELGLMLAEKHAAPANISPSTEVTVGERAEGPACAGPAGRNRAGEVIADTTHRMFGSVPGRFRWAN